MSSLVEPVEGVDVVLVRADNPGPLTLSGTNTWVVGRDPAWVVDPGPDMPEHLDAIAEVVSARGGAGGIAVTHDHADHSAGAEALRALLGNPPDHATGTEALRARLGGVPIAQGPLEAIPIPGHADDHVAFVWERVAFTGDAVLGEGSVFVTSRLAEYLAALRRLREMDLALICPGHGPVVRDPAGKLDEYVAHRLDRERRLIDALERGLRDEEELLDAAWSEVPAMLRPAAAITLRAHLEKLRHERRLPR